MAGVNTRKSNLIVAASVAPSALIPFSSAFSLKITLGSVSILLAIPFQAQCGFNTAATSVTTLIMGTYECPVAPYHFPPFRVNFGRRNCSTVPAGSRTSYTRVGDGAVPLNSPTCIPVMDVEPRGGGGGGG